MSGQVKNQHYIPRMYLKRFGTTGEKINVWDIRRGVILPNQNAQNFAARRYYYDAPKNALTDVLLEIRELFPDEIDSLLKSGNEQIVENALGRSESELVHILDQLNYDPAIMYKSQSMSKIIVFLHDLAYRSEAFRIATNKVQKATGNLGEYKGTENNLGKLAQLYYLSGLKPLLHTAEVLQQYSWYYGIVQGNSSLVISDNPAQAIATGFNDICFPISGQRAIILRINDSNAPLISADFPCDGIIQLSNQSVFAYNALQLSFANRYMFGNRKTLENLKALCVEKEIIR